MTTMSRPKHLTATAVPSVLQLKASQFGETPEDVSRIAERIRAGEAFLKVVAYPWGVEFEVCSKEGGK